MLIEIAVGKGCVYQAGGVASSNRRKVWSHRWKDTVAMQLRLYMKSDGWYSNVLPGTVDRTRCETECCRFPEGRFGGM